MPGINNMVRQSLPVAGSLPALLQSGTCPAPGGTPWMGGKSARSWDEDAVLARSEAL